MNFTAFLNTISSTARTLPIVIFYVTEGCNLKCITCSYRAPMPGELTLDEIKSLASNLNSLGLRHIVYSGGEPLLRRDFTEICDAFAKFNVKQSILTNGLLLEKRIEEIYKYFNEIIVSIDGADAETHNKIRGLNSFDQILKGVTKSVSLFSPSFGGTKGSPEVSIRTVVQKNNFRQVPKMISMAKSLGVSRISFLSADVESDAFGRENQKAVNTYPLPAYAGRERGTSRIRDGGGVKVENDSILLNKSEVKEFREIVNAMFTDFKSDFDSGFISESPAKMLRLVDYFDAYLGNSAFPENICNAPNVSAVITSTGDIHPCFFLPKYGNIRKNSFKELINSDSIKDTRGKVKNFEMERCKTCVCTLQISRKAALLNKF